MSGGFSFPPPPPPPPKAGAGEENRILNFGGQDRSRGRASQSRGNPSHRVRSNYVNRNDFSNSSNQNFNVRTTPNAPRTAPQNGAIIESAFAAPNNVRTWGAPHGQSKVAASQPDHASKTDLFTSPSRTVAGQKRKLEVLRGPQKEKKPLVPAVPATPNFFNSFSPLTNFQSPQSLAKSAKSDRADQEGIQPRSRSLGLTPAANGPQYSSSSEDDEDNDEYQDEEAEFAEIGDKLTFEHNGIVTTLKSHADLIAWRKERQKKWPTQKRVLEKEEERRTVGVERRRLLAAASALYEPSHRNPHRNKISEALISVGARDESTIDSMKQRINSNDNYLTSKVEQTGKSLEAPKSTLEDLRSKVAASAAKNRQARITLDAASKSDTNSAGQPGALDGGVVDQAVGLDSEAKEIHKVVDPGCFNGLSSERPSSLCSSSEAASESDDDVPEELPSKPSAGSSSQLEPDHQGVVNDGSHSLPNSNVPSRIHATKLAQKARPAPAGEKFQRQQHYESLSHSQTKSEKKTIFLRLVEQEEDRSAQLALEVIKYLGRAGFFESSDSV